MVIELNNFRKECNKYEYSNYLKGKREVMVELTADDLVIICNALYAQLGEKKYNDIFMQLYSDMMMARDLCQYGHVDDFAFTIS